MGGPFRKLVYASQIVYRFFSISHKHQWRVYPSLDKRSLQKKDIIRGVLRDENGAVVSSGFSNAARIIVGRKRFFNGFRRARARRLESSRPLINRECG